MLFDVTEHPPVAPTLLIGAIVLIIAAIAGYKAGAFVHRRLIGAVLSYLIIVAVGAVFAIEVSWTRLKNALREGRCEVIEGVVTHFVPMPPEGHAPERFMVGGQLFTYSSYGISPGFSWIRANGGPIENGVYIRIHHLGNDIARLEVADTDNTRRSAK